MAKRFIDSDLWKRPWFSDLPVNAKLIWFYLITDCDHRGVWIANFKRISCDIGISVNAEFLEKYFKEKVIKFESDKYFIPSFIKFQYGELKSENRAHKAVIEFLSQYEGKIKDLTRSLEGPKDKDKEKDKEKEPAQKFDFESLYQLYPRHEGKTEGLKRCRSQIKTPEDYEKLKTAILNYKQTATDPKYTKHFSSFMSCWQDYVNLPPERRAAEFNNMTDTIIKAIAKYGPYKGDKAREDLGTLWADVKAVGGWGFLCAQSDYQVREVLNKRTTARTA